MLINVMLIKKKIYNIIFLDLFHPSISFAKKNSLISVMYGYKNSLRNKKLEFSIVYINQASNFLKEQHMGTRIDL